MDVDRVVRRHRAALLDTAFLLTGAERPAEDRVDRALARLSPDDDHATAVAALLRTRAPRGEVVEAGADPWWVGPAELAAARRTAAALAELDPADRVALVLDHEDLPADAARVARARTGFADPSAALTGLLAVRRPPARDDAATAVLVAARRRARRRRPLVALVVLVLLAAVASRLPSRSTDPAPVAADRFGGPTRGSLAGDDAFLDAVRDAPWDGAPGDRRVVFAGDVLDHRWVLVAGTTPDGTVGRWSTGPVGAAPDRLAPADPVVLRADDPAALLLDTELVVVADPDEGVRVSTGQVVGPSGAVQRVFAALPVDDGVAALRLAAPDPGGIALRVQVARVGSYAAYTLADLPVTVAGSASVPSARSDLVPLRGTEPDLGARRQAVEGAVAAVTAHTGQDPAALDPVLLWAGSLPHPLGGSVDAVVVAVEQPSGAVVVSTGWADRLENGTVQQVGCGSRAFPAGTDPATLAVAARCIVADRNTGTAAVTVLVTTASSTTLAPDDLRDSVVVLDVTDGTPIQVSSTGPGDLFDE